MRTTKDYPEAVSEAEMLAGCLPQAVKEGNRMLPAWLTEAYDDGHMVLWSSD